MNTARTTPLFLAAALTTLVACGGSAPSQAAATEPASAATPGASPTPSANAATPVTLSGTLAAQAFAAQSAVWVPLPDQGGAASVLVVAADVPNLCAVLHAATQKPRAIFVQLEAATGQPLAAGSFTVAAPPATTDVELAPAAAPQAVTNLAAAGDNVFASAGTLSVTSLDVAGKGPLQLAVDEHDDAGNTLTGTVVATYCGADTVTSTGTTAAAAATGSTGTTTVNNNNGSGSTNNNNANNNGVTTTVSGGNGSTPVIVNVSINNNNGDGNTNNNNTNNNTGSGAANNNNNNNNSSAGAAQQPTGLIPWLFAHLLAG